MTLAPWLCIKNANKQAVNAVAVDSERVSIVGAFYGGQDHEAALESNRTTSTTAHQATSNTIPLRKLIRRPPLRLSGLM